MDKIHKQIEFLIFQILKEFAVNVTKEVTYNNPGRGIIFQVKKLTKYFFKIIFICLF